MKNTSNQKLYLAYSPFFICTPFAPTQVFALLPFTAAAVPLFSAISVCLLPHTQNRSDYSQVK